MPTRLILDTDIGTDVDDIVTLALLLASPEIELVGVTTVYADVALRARMVQKMLSLRGRTNIPVFAGESTPLAPTGPLYWEGHEGTGLLDEADHRMPVQNGGVDFLVQTIRENPGAVHLLAIGPLTNVARAFTAAPEIAGMLAGLTIMGGHLNYDRQAPGPRAEHNIRLDPEAADIVLRAAAEPTLIPLDVTLKVNFSSAMFETLCAQPDAFHQALAEQMRRYPPFATRGTTFMHDPLAGASIIQPDLVRLVNYRAEVVLADRPGLERGALAMQAAEDGGPITYRAAVEVDAPLFESFLIERLVR